MTSEPGTSRPSSPAPEPARALTQTRSRSSASPFGSSPAGDSPDEWQEPRVPPRGRPPSPLGHTASQQWQAAQVCTRIHSNSLSTLKRLRLPRSLVRRVARTHHVPKRQVTKPSGAHSFSAVAGSLDMLAPSANNEACHQATEAFPQASRHGALAPLRMTHLWHVHVQAGQQDDAAEQTTLSSPRNDWQQHWAQELWHLDFAS